MKKETSFSGFGCVILAAGLGKRFGGGKQLYEPLPYDETPMAKYDNNPFLPDGGNGMRAEDGTLFLAPYWYGRYYGLLGEM